MTSFSQFRTAVGHELGLDANADGTGAECPDVDLWIQQGVERVLMDTACYVTSESFLVSTLTAVTSLGGAITDYLLPSEVLEITDMYISSSGFSPGLERVAVPDLIDQRRMSMPSNTPTQVYALSGAQLLMFWPLPAATDTIELYYVPVPGALSLTGDDPSTLAKGGIPKQLHKAIQYWACAEGASYDDDQSSGQGQRYRDDYNSELVRYKKFLRKRGGIRNQRARVNGSRRTRTFHTNDVYYSGR